MDRDTAPRSPAAGGALIALGAVAGALVGLFLGSATQGFLVGLGAGVAISIAMWLLDLRQ